VKSIQKHLTTTKQNVREILTQLDKLASDAILFIVDENQKLIGSITDGDIRRGLIKGLGLEDEITKFIQSDPKFFRQGEFDLIQMQDWRIKNFKIIPVLDAENKVIDIVNFRFQK